MKTIEYNISWENLISRIPALFAYVEIDDLGVKRLHSANDSADGCYGKIVENIRLPQDVNLVVDGNTVLYSGKIYTYRTLIDYYYQYNGKENVTGGFIEFINAGIGKISTQSIYRDEYIQLPNYVYLVNVPTLYNEMINLKRLCENYTEEEKKHGEVCCICQKYIERGGDDFVYFLNNLFEKLETTTSKYYSYATPENGEELAVNLHVLLTNTINDLGLVSDTIENWVPLKLYQIGDKVLYENELYVCTKENSGIFDEKTETVSFDYSSFNIVNSDYFEGEIGAFVNSTKNKYTQEEYQDIGGQTDSKLNDLKRSIVYVNESEVAETPAKGRDWLFYYRKGIIVGNINFKTDDLGNIVKLSNPEEAATASEGGICDDLYAFGNCITDITYENGYIKFNYILDAHLKATLSKKTQDENNKDLYHWKNYQIDTGGDINYGISYEEQYYVQSGSELQRLAVSGIKIDEIKDEHDVVIVPETTIYFDEYVLGKYIYDKISGATLSNGTIIIDFERTINSNLVTRSIYLDSKNFGDNVTAVTMVQENIIRITDNGQEVNYQISNFENDWFDVENLLPFNKFEFLTENTSISQSRIINNQNVDFSVNLTNFNMELNSNDNMVVNDIIGNYTGNGTTTAESYDKHDDIGFNLNIIREEYYNGITYSPITDIDVNINRGTNAAFEKHIRLGEIKTLEDLTEDPFFKITDTQ